MRVQDLLNYVREREAVRLRREADLPPPWTRDPIIQNYRFCCVQREDDVVTRWIAENWREPHRDDPDLWFAMVVARHLNLPGSLAELGFPVPWDPRRFRTVLGARKARRDKVYSNAYMIMARSAGGMSGYIKTDYLEEYVLSPLWAQRERLQPHPGDTLNAYHMLLGQFYGLASFMSGQVVADLKYAPPLSEASDWWTFAASGPGSRRGLNRVLGQAPDSHWTEDDWRLELSRLQYELVPAMVAEGLPRLHGQDVQNCLCEFDKYERTRLGEGRPKQKYRPSLPASEARAPSTI